MFKKISPRKISEEIIEQFKDLLKTGEIKPGDELPPERDLADLLGVSRPPLREALNVLQAMGFLEIRPRSKIIVKSLTKEPLEEPLSLLIEDDIDKVFELMDIRKAMEGWAAYKAAKTATKEDIERLQIIVGRDQQNLHDHRNDAKTDADFHVSIALAAHNTLLSHLMGFCYHLLWNTQRLAREKIFTKEKNRKLIVENHLRIFEAIKNGDADGASEEARNHIDFVERELRKVLAEEGSES
jgi:GntR family transcriptional repressor for pyruvate dehydrogenase complex